MRQYNLFELERNACNYNSSDKELKNLIELIKSYKENDFKLIGFTSEDTENYNSNKKSLITRKTYTRLVNIIWSAIKSLSIENEVNIQFLLELTYLKKITTPILYSSIYENPDYFMVEILNNLKQKDNQVVIDKLTKMKICAVYSLSSTVSIQELSKLFINDNVLFVVLCLSLLTENTILTMTASKNRDWILNNLPEKLNEISASSELEGFNLPLPQPYFLCSYSTDKNRHRIKESMHDLIRRLKIFPQLEEISAIVKNKKLENKSSSKILVIHEEFNSTHAIYRCYFNFLNILSKKHTLIGACFNKRYIDDKSKLLFNNHYIIDESSFSGKFGKLRDVIIENEIDIIYYPAIGMTLETILTSSYRLAPKQVMTLAHPAPSYSKTIDCVISYEGIAKSEMDPYTNYKLLKRTHPMILITNRKCETNWKVFNRTDKSNIKIAITATPMKVTAEFIEILYQLSLKYLDEIEFVFHDAEGLEVIRNSIEVYLKDKLHSPVCVKARSKYDDYLNSLRACDLSASPYPFGSHNGFLDCTLAGLLGPSLIKTTFPQNTERHYYMLSSFDSLIASSENEYINILSDLIDFLLQKKAKSDYLPLDIKKPSEIIDILSDCTINYAEDILSCF